MTAVRWITIGLATLMALIAVGVALALHGQSTGWMVRKRTVETWITALEPHLTILSPFATAAGAKAGTDDTAPVMLIFPGCGGTREHHTRWAEIATQEGYFGIIVDSFAPRGLGRERALREVCSGSRLWGRERAGDVAAMLTWLRDLPGADAEQVVLFGQSHGAWSIMDLLSMDLSRQTPTPLSDPLQPDILSGVQGTVLFYPYCGAFSMTGEKGWTVQPEGLMYISGQDEVVSALACRRTAEWLTASGVPLTVHELPDAGHAFDEFSLPEDSPLTYRPDLAARATAEVRQFLRKAKTGK